MTFTYGLSPGTSTAAERRDAVRYLVGDTDSNDPQVEDEEITFALSEADDGIYLAAAITARAIAGKYARRVDTDFEGVSTAYSDRQKHYQALAVKLEKEALTKGASLGSPGVGGISESTMDSVEDNEDRVEPAFRRRQHRNPPDIDSDDESFWDYHNL